MIKELKIDPRTKLVIVLCLSTLGIATKNTQALFVVSSLAFLMTKLFKVDLKRSFKRIRGLLYILLFIALVQSFFSQGQPLVSIGHFKILTIDGVNKAIQFILRMITVIFSANIIGTSNSREIIQGLVQWKLPYDIAFMVALGIRFLPMIGEEIKDSLIAIQLRGVEIKSIPLKERINLYSYIFTPILVGAILKAERLSTAIEMRGFRAYDSRTSFLVLKLSRMDYLTMFLSIGFTLLFLIKINI